MKRWRPILNAAVAPLPLEDGKILELFEGRASSSWETVTMTIPFPRESRLFG
jgi:hypothetical protein